METTLPTYTPSPIPVPVFLHSPSRSNAVPYSPAIRLHPAGSAVGPASTPGLSGPGSAPRVIVTAPGGAGGTAWRSARFVDDGDDTTGNMDNNSSRYSLSTSTTGHTSHQSNNVTFQTRSRGYTIDSAHSAEFPTFAAYRQSQHGNFEALAQRFKRAFVISQQTNEQQQQQQMAMMQSPASNELSPSMSTDPPSYYQSIGGQTVSSPTAISLTATAAILGTTGTGAGVQTRSRSTSAANMFSDIAGRLRSGSLFSRSSTTNNITGILPVASAATVPDHYPHISSSANSEVVHPSLHSSSYSAPYSSYPSSSVTHIPSTMTMTENSATTAINTEIMPTLQLLASQSPLSQTGHDRTPSSIIPSQTPQDRQHSPLVYDSNNNEDGNEGGLVEGVFAASSPQFQLHLVSTEKHSEKPSEPTSPNSHHR
ncbi:hypothetical protein BG015_007403 [Linnemannia schmuckeri]|uniref:Uncharacterized protein n=1 Tax=Linnemannia schmuckeri TaxID=64567 RepID=A0A9P5RYI3_9FUNG|nr:hypothetical protein BG015_007403 [Linnemannia schmuckeri]